jgi:acyl carrier protein
MTTSEKLNLLIADKLNIKTEEIKPESSFSNDLGADSLDVVELMMEIEKDFNIKIEDGEMEGIKTVQDAVNLIETKLKK